MEENIYPTELKDFKKTIIDYYDSMDKFGKILLKAVAISLNIDEGLLINGMNRPDATSTLRLNYYPN
jgi:isopenicillin N synthase-like dioxygenase